MLFSCSVVSDSLWPHGLQHARLPCPSPSPRACSNSCPWSWWCHPTISSSAAPFSSCLQSFPASGAFLMSQLFVSGGQSIGASASVLPMNIQDWFPLGLTVLFCLNSLFPPTIWHLLQSLWNSLRNSAVVEIVSIFCLLTTPCSCHATQKRTLRNPSSWQKLFACIFLSGRPNLKKP